MYLSDRNSVGIQMDSIFFLLLESVEFVRVSLMTSHIQTSPSTDSPVLVISTLMTSLQGSIDVTMTSSFDDVTESSKETRTLPGDMHASAANDTLALEGEEQSVFVSTNPAPSVSTVYSLLTSTLTTLKRQQSPLSISPTTAEGQLSPWSISLQLHYTTTENQPSPLSISATTTGGR